MYNARNNSKKRTIRLVDEMIEKGTLAGKFWRVSHTHNSQITVTKFQRHVTLKCPQEVGVQVGDKISFIATLEKLESEEIPLWHPTTTRYHSSSLCKYLISVPALLLLFISALRHLKFDVKNLSLVYRKRAL